MPFSIVTARRRVDALDRVDHTRTVDRQRVGAAVTAEEHPTLHRYATSWSSSTLTAAGPWVNRS